MLLVSLDPGFSRNDRQGRFRLNPRGSVLGFSLSNIPLQAANHPVDLFTVFAEEFEHAVGFGTQDDPVVFVDVFGRNQNMMVIEKADNGVIRIEPDIEFLGQRVEPVPEFFRVLQVVGGNSDFIGQGSSVPAGSFDPDRYVRAWANWWTRVPSSTSSETAM